MGALTSAWHAQVGREVGPLARSHCEKRKVIPESMCSSPYKNINPEKPRSLGDTNRFSPGELPGRRNESQMRRGWARKS